MNEKVKSDSRNVAIVGPYLSGKTTLLESLLFVTGAITRKGNVKDGNTVGDSAAQSCDRRLSIEVSAASTEYNGIRFTFVDCPGNVEFAQETYNALIGVDAAIVVCEPITDRVLTLLEPIVRLFVTTPSEFTAKVLQLVSGWRGQILGYEGIGDWQGWDNVTAYLPQAEMQNFIVELRSLTLGVGSFHWEYDHLQEVPEKLASTIIACSNGNGSNGNK